MRWLRAGRGARGRGGAAVDRAGGWIELIGEPADEARLADAVGGAGFVWRGAAPRQF
jgi:hypothetical protein